jgi:hypothetical protein
MQVKSAGSMTNLSDLGKIDCAVMHVPPGKTIMTGIRYLTDDKGRKVAVQIDLKKHQELWEDLQDVLISRSRRHEKRISLDSVKARLIRSGKLARG